jgi:hypothetical protein
LIIPLALVQLTRVLSRWILHQVKWSENKANDAMRARDYLIVIATMCLFVTGCESSHPVTTASDITSSSLAPGSLGTISSIDLQLTWSPAESPPATDADKISTYLRDHHAHMLLPSAAPVEGRSSAEFWALSHSGTDDITSSVTVRINAQATPLLSLSAESGPPRNNLTGSAVTIRGVQGVLNLNPDAVSFLQWQEQTQTFIAEFTSADYKQMVSWLNEWQTVR